MNIQEQKILENIEEGLKTGPSFPVTSTKKVSVDYFTNVWVKDESTQETGTHKDRMAWEIVMVYRDILKLKERGLDDLPLPQFSIISAGSAALAIQTQLREYGLPNLKILVDNTTNSIILDYLENLGCQIYKTDLGQKVLMSTDILMLTDNLEGFDITSNKALDPNIIFYDWLAYEVLNENPDYVFVPYGTGHLYENILNISKNIIQGRNIDSVYSGNKNILSRCHFIGATTDDAETLAVKLYAPFRPFSTSSLDWIKLFIRRGFCGKNSKISEVSEEFIKKGNELMTKLGINAEYSASAGLGLLYQLKEKIPKDSKILIINQGKAQFPF